MCSVGFLVSEFAGTELGPRSTADRRGLATLQYSFEVPGLAPVVPAFLLEVP